MYTGLPNANMLIPLKKMQISIMKSGVAKDTFEVLYNPKEYVRSRKVEYSDEGGLSMDTPITQFSHGSAEVLTFTLFFDSMSAGGEVGGKVLDKAKFTGNSILPSVAKQLDVRDYTDKVYKLMEVDPKQHVPPLLRLDWSSLKFTGHLMECEQTFTRFNERGTPVRAWLKCTFREFISNTGTKSLQSPDTTKFRTVHQGDALWSMAAREYGEASEWREIAGANNIANPRVLRSGETLTLPALKRK